MKLIIAIGSLLLSATAYAGSITAPGKVFYKKSNGELIEKHVSLTVPDKGEGAIYLSGGIGLDQIELVADRHFSKEKNGRTIFVMIFSNFPGAKPGEKAMFKGTYTRGNNVALYYGDVYLVKGGGRAHVKPHQRQEGQGAQEQSYGQSQQYDQQGYDQQQGAAQNEQYQHRRQRMQERQGHGHHDKQYMAGFLFKANISSLD